MDRRVEERVAICRRCPLMRMTEDGMKCDDRKYLSPDGTQTSFFKHEGWTKGCGCLCAIKARNPNNHCVAGLW